VSEHVVMIGACGWQHPEWTGEFYPDDLPEEWLLGYYGNEYPVVMVPAEYWAQGEETIEEWLEESDESLRFLAQWPDSSSPDSSKSDSSISEEQKQQARTGLKIVSEQVSGILIPISGEVSAADWDEYKSLAKQYPLSFDLGNEPDATSRAMLKEHFTDQPYNICWYGNAQNGDDIQSGSIGVCRLSGEIEPKDLRVIMENMVKSSSDKRSLILIVDGQPPAMQLLTNAGIILDLL